MGPNNLCCVVDRVSVSIEYRLAGAYYVGYKTSNSLEALNNTTAAIVL